MVSGTCALCGQGFVARTARKMYCSGTCKDRARPSAKWKGGVKAAEVVCGTASAYRSGCRCDECRTAQRVKMAEYQREIVPEFGASRSALYKRKRRGVPLSAQACDVCGEPLKKNHFRDGALPRHTECSGRFHIPDADRAFVYARDDWMCHLCGERTDPGVHFHDNRYPSVDHIIPRLFGGGHEVTNLATAHRGCNSRRGARLLEVFHATEVSAGG